MKPNIEEVELKPSLDEVNGLIADRLGDDEPILWTGRPLPRRTLYRPVANVLLGTYATAFVLVWSTMVALGGNNNWDRGQPVPRFAAHNVAISAIALCWMLPFSLTMLTDPIRRFWKARRTVYVLTRKHAYVVQPKYRGGYTVDRYWWKDLGGMKREEKSDGSGSLIFKEIRPWWGRLGQEIPFGFLGIEHFAEVEDILSATEWTSGQKWLHVGEVPDRPKSSGWF